MGKIKKYSKENIHIKITDFELRNVSFYGCDAGFDLEIRDSETDVLLDTDYEIVDNAFMGVDDSEDLYSFLEEKEIDFSEEYDDDYDQLPDKIKKEFEEYELELYNDIYHEDFFDGEENAMEEIIGKVTRQLYLPDNKFYIVKGEEVGWIEVESDYFGVHLSSDTVKIHKVYNVDMQDWICETDGAYFVINDNSYNLSRNYNVVLFERDVSHPYKVTAEDFENDTYPGYRGKVGDVIFDYHAVYEESE